MGIYVYMFGDGLKGSAVTFEDKKLLGGKGANLGDMSRIGLPVPYGFTITTEACNYFSEQKKWVPELEEQIKGCLAKLEKKTGKKFGTDLFVSVRSGSAFSMPGMMDTVLNLGLNDKTIKSLIEKTRNERFACDCYRRLLQMFGNVVLEVEHDEFEEILERYKKGRRDVDLSADELKSIVEEYKNLIKKKTGREFPQDPVEQLNLAINAVFQSWNNKRAITYRKLNKIDDNLGTAVNVQEMVFGNMGNDSGTGVAFTRNPSTGEKEYYGEYLLNAQGEDVVAGIRTPHPIKDLEKDLPKCYKELIEVYHILENHYKDVQDFEFTIEKNRLFILQTRTGKRTAAAAVKIAFDMANEKLIDKKTAVLRVDPNQLDQLLHRRIDPKAKPTILAKGLAASPGAASGEVVFDADVAVDLAERKKKVILVRPETTPEDIHGLNAAQGVVTSRGGMTCIAGDALVLTGRGFLTAEKTFEAIEDGEKFSILSYNNESGKTVWKKIIAAGRRPSDVIEVSVSQTGHSERNTLKITADHKMIIPEGRALRKKPINDVIEDKEFISIVDRIPFSEESISNRKLAYLTGALLTDGYIRLERTKGCVVFTQKPTEEKEHFIETVDSYFNDVFGFEFSRRMKYSSGMLRGRLIEGEAMDLICSRREPAMMLTQISQNIGQWVMALDEESTFEFLAGVIDGDGAFYNNRIQIYASKQCVLEGVVLACLKLGIVPQVTVNRTIYNIQIVERIDNMLGFTKRVKGETRKKILGTKLFPVRQIFSDIADDVNFMGRVKEGVKRNIMFDARKIEKDILPLCTENDMKALWKMLNSDIRMYRVKKTADLGTTFVYNFEVEDENDMDKNFVVFTRMYTPLLVSNSHAAVVARGMGKPCVAGCGDVKINIAKKVFTAGSHTIKEGDVITIDGSTGEVMLGAVPTIEPKLSSEFNSLLEWADEYRKLGVMANGDTPKDALKAQEFGAQGIGLCRTEHMFFAEDRLPVVRAMIMSTSEEERRMHLDKLLPMQKTDFLGILEAMDGLPVTIRLIDPPLHEFLPSAEELIEEVTKLKCEGKNAEKEEALLHKVKALQEMNPMLGLRGCRLGIVYPEIVEMQVRAIIEAAIELKKKGKTPKPEIMIPLVAMEGELKFEREIVERVAKETMEKAHVKIDYKIGTMIELPRAALTADKVAEHAEFFSFGTNDLTQTTYGFSRDDVEGKFFKDYMDKKIMKEDPFVQLDQEGVGKLVKMGVELGRKTRPDLKIGICGEHGGDPSSVEFCHNAGLTYVSCSPFRVPIARLAAAQAALKTSDDSYTTA